MSTSLPFWMRGLLSALLATSFGLAGACAAGEAPANEATEETPAPSAELRIAHEPTTDDELPTSNRPEASIRMASAPAVTNPIELVAGEYSPVSVSVLNERLGLGNDPAPP